MAKKRHHYVPVFYLNGFSSDTNRIYVFPKDSDEIIEASPRDVAVIKHYYSFTIDAEGTKDSETIEDFFQKLETKTAPPIAKLNSKSTLTSEEREWISIFLAMSMLRVPKARDWYKRGYEKLIKGVTKFVASDRDHFESYFKKVLSDRKEPVNVSLDELREFALDETAYEIDAGSEFSLQIIGHIHDVAMIINDMTWSYFESTSDYSFITSDNPFCMANTKLQAGHLIGAGLTQKNTEVTFPISKSLAMLCSWSEAPEGYLPSNNKLVKEVNNRTVAMADKYIFTHFKDNKLKKIIKTGSQGI